MMMGAWIAASDDPRVVGIVLTGNGRGFSAGTGPRLIGAPGLPPRRPLAEKEGSSLLP